MSETCERGSIVGFFLIIIAVVGLLGAGLIWDGAASLNAHARALDLASQAARAGADQISARSLRTGSSDDLRIDPVAAQAAAQRLLNDAGATGTLTVTGNVSVSVTARVPQRAAILEMIGIRDLSGTATAHATLLQGISTVIP